MAEPVEPFEQVEPAEPVESLEEIVRRKIAIEHSKLEKALRVKCVAAPKILENIVHLALQIRNVDREVYQKSLRLFAENMKNASVYKKRAVGERISKLDMPTKIAIVQNFLEVGMETFSLELCLSKNNQRGAVTDSIMKFKKPKCPMAMAFGLNKNGRLGIGSDKDRVDVMTPVDIFVEIKHAFMGPNHTIFQSKTGEIYGCGLKSNFMERARGSNDIVTIPTKMDCYRGDPSVTPNIILGETHTRIVEFTSLSTMIIGTDPSSDQDVVRSKGNNFMFVNNKSRTEENQEIRERQIKEIEVDVHEKPRRKIKVRDDTVWVGRNEEKLDIVFIVDGYRVDSEKLWKNYTVCTTGKVMAIIDNNIYKGKFLIVPRKKNNDELNDQLSEDEEDEEEEGQVVGNDVYLVARNDILLCILEEIALPYAFDGLTVTEDGESFIAWSHHDTFDDSEYEKYRVYESLETIDFRLKTKERTVFDAAYLNHLFDSAVESEIKRMGSFYMNSGQPKCKSLIRGLLALIRFLRIDQATGVPEVLLNNLRRDNTLDVRAVEKEFEEALIEASKLSVVVPKPDFDSEAREAEVRKASRNYYLDINQIATEYVRNLKELPTKYRSNTVESAFGVFVARIIQSIDLVDVEALLPTKYEQPPNRMFKRNHFQEALKKRSPDQPELDLQQIRVEASPLILRQTEPSDHIADHHAYYIYTTEFHIKCIDASLLEHVNEDNVLNLNILCLHDTDHYRFLELLDSFFLLRDDFLHLKNFERALNFESAMESLPEPDVYTIKTSDDKTVKIPKYLFEVYSEYDAGRQNFGEGPNGRNAFELGCTDEALKLLANCLIDVRIFFRASMKLKMEVYELAKYLLIRHIWNELRLMIILTAEESDADYIGDLIEQTDEKEDILALIVKHRPEIIFFWKQFPAKDHLFVIQNIAGGITAARQRFKNIEDEIGSVNLPIIAMRDEMVDKEMIPETVLTKYLCNKEDDEVVTFECTRSALNWNVENPRKRRHEDRNVYMPRVP